MLCFPCWECAQRIFDWENLNVVGHNKEDYHSTLMLPSRKSECKEIMLLNGMWKFMWSPDPQSRPLNFYKRDHRRILSIEIYHQWGRENRG